MGLALDALDDVILPEDLLMGSGAGAVVAARVLEKGGYLEPEKAEQPSLAQHSREVILEELRLLGLVVPATHSTNPSARELRDEDCELERAPASAEHDAESSASVRKGVGGENAGVPFPSETSGSEPSRASRPHRVEDDVRRCRAVLGLRTGRIDPYGD